MTTVLSDSNVLIYSAAHFETHGIFHFFLNTSTISQDQDHVDANEHTDDEDEELGGNSVGSLHRYLLNFDAFSLVEIDAYLGLVDQVRANVLQNVLRSYITTEGHTVNSH